MPYTSDSPQPIKDTSKSDRQVPNWTPLEIKLRLTLGPENIRDAFMWMRRYEGIEFYKHIYTGRYLLLDSALECWKFVNERLEAVDFEFQLSSVLDHAKEERPPYP